MEVQTSKKTVDLKPKIKTRTINHNVYKKALEDNIDPFLAKIIAARDLGVFSAKETLYPELKNIPHPKDLADIEKATKRIVKAIVNNEYIGLETDHDCDGQTSHAILYDNLINKFNVKPEKIRSYIGHRLEEGYGLSSSVAKRILQENPKCSLIITADNGSSDEERIKLLKENNIDVIVTDHHAIPILGIPKSAYACINPVRKDCNYEDNYIAGCMVSWLLMVSVRNELIEQNILEKDAPKLADTLDFVAVGTIADCVSIAKSQINRAVVKYGLKVISQFKRPCWKALARQFSNPISAEDLGFKIGPLLNSDGRLSSALDSVSFLLAKTDKEALAWVDSLEQQNIARKSIQSRIINYGFTEAQKQVLVGNFGLSIYQEDGHPGVHGIAASRIKDHFGMPTVFLAPKFNDPEIITGSMRGIDNFNVKTSLDFIHKLDENLFLSYGGHTGAGGLSFKKENLLKFKKLFERSVRTQLNLEQLGPVIYIDGNLDYKYINLDTVSLIRKLEPFGREFEPPQFLVKAKINKFQAIGDGTHAKVILDINNKLFSAIWFGFRKNSAEIIEFNVLDQVETVVVIKENTFNGITNVQLQISIMYKI